MPDRFGSPPADRLIAEFPLWSTDPVRLAQDLDRIAPHADILHVDAADGHFAPALLYFPDLVAQVRKVSSVPVHSHLIRARGLPAGIVLKVTTPVVVAGALVPRIDFLTLLGTAIGVKGQGLDPTACGLRAAGAETVVLGTLAFGAPDLAARMAWLRGRASGPPLHRRQSRPQGHRRGCRCCAGRPCADRPSRPPAGAGRARGTRSIRSG